MSSTDFWSIETHSGDDYQRIRVNGLVDHPVGLPGIDCPKCRDVWAGPSGRLLPFRLPARLERQLTALDGPISPAEYRDLRSGIRRSLQRRRATLVNLGPGCDFAPVIWRRTNPPALDVYMTGGGLLVNARARRLLHQVAGSAVGFAPVDLRIGRPPQGRRRIEEPEDLLAGQTDRRGRPAQEERWYQVAVYARSNPPPSYRIHRRCSVCGNVFARWPRGRGFRMREGMWRGHDLFFLPPTTRIIVTDRLKCAFEERGITGCEFEPA